MFRRSVMFVQILNYSNMSTEEIIEANVHIAAMLNWYYDTKGLYYSYLFDGGKDKTELLFHLDWNWLMLAVDFIEGGKKVRVDIGGNHCHIQEVGNKENRFEGKIFSSTYAKDKITATFIGVYLYAKYFNKI